MKTASLTLAAALALAACGGGDADEAPLLTTKEWTAENLLAQTATTVETAPCKRIHLYGDSTQLGGYGTSVAEIAQGLLPTRCIVNRGIGGSTITQFIAGSSTGLPWAREVAQKHGADLVVVNFGINDWRYSQDAYRTGLMQFISTARAAGKLVMLETPNPVWRTVNPDGTLYSRPLFWERVAIMRDVARVTNVALCDQHAKLEAAGIASETDDGLHPKPIMLQYKGRFMAACAEKALAGATGAL